MIFILIALAVLGIWSFRHLTEKNAESFTCLVGKTAIITGGNSGIGYATALLLASRGCRVIIADKVNAEESRDSIIKVTGNSEILTKYLDLSSLKSVRTFSEDIMKNEKKIDILINNAGVGSSSKVLTIDGLNSTMQINYFGAFLLTHLLVDSLKEAKSAQVIFTGSAFAFIHNLSQNNLNDMNQSTDLLSLFRLYGNTKLCNILAAKEFAKKLRKHGISVNSTDPGIIRTGLFQDSWIPTHLSWIHIFNHIVRVGLSSSPMTGAQTNFYLASSLDIEGKTGGHYFLCRSWFRPRILDDEEFCKQIWQETEKLVGLRDEEKLFPNNT